MRTVRRSLFSLFRHLMRSLGGYGLGRKWPFRPLLPRLVTALNPGAATVRGHTLKLDPHDSLRLSIDPDYEPSSSRLFEQTIKTGDTVLDLGANIGYYTLIAAHKVGDRGRVIAFEPDPDNIALLRHNVLLNGFENVDVECAAATDRCGQAYLWKNRSNWGGHSLIARGNKRKRLTVRATTVDAYYASRSEGVNFIKMDLGRG